MLPPAAKQALAKLRQDNVSNSKLQASLDRVEAVLEGREPYETYDEESGVESDKNSEASV